MPKKILVIILILLLLIMVVSGCLPQSPSDPQGSLTLHFIDVGQGDAILLVAGDQAMLVDSGLQQAGKTVADYIRSLGIRKLDYVVASHNHNDHTGGLLTILKSFKVEHYWMAESDPTKPSEKALEAAKDQGSLVEQPAIQTTTSLGDARVTVLGPLKDYKEANDDSLVLKVSHGNKTFLLTGDMEAAAERDLVESGAALEADLLKVGHHGGASSSTYLFLRSVNPKYAVISCGLDNEYGHPHADTISRLNDVGAQIFQTNTQGTIVATSLNNDISFNVVGRQPTQDHQSEENGLISAGLIGNLNSKVYHLASCGSLPKEENRIYFADFNEALKQDYRPCSRCRPPS